MEYISAIQSYKPAGKREAAEQRSSCRSAARKGFDAHDMALYNILNQKARKLYRQPSILCPRFP